MTPLVAPLATLAMDESREVTLTTKGMINHGSMEMAIVTTEVGNNRDNTKVISKIIVAVEMVEAVGEEIGIMTGGDIMATETERMTGIGGYLMMSSHQGVKEEDIGGNKNPETQVEILVQNVIGLQQLDKNKTVEEEVAVEPEDNQKKLVKNLSHLLSSSKRANSLH